MRAPREHPPRNKGDVATIDRVAGERGDMYGIRVALHGHTHRYVVRVASGTNGPRLVDLQIQSDSDATITPDVLRAIPSRRLAHAAAQWAHVRDGLFGFLRLDEATREALYEKYPDDPEEFDRAAAEAVAALKSRPEASTARGKLDDAHYRRVAEHVSKATAAGKTRKDIAPELKTTVPTLDRWIREAKERGLLGTDQPRRTDTGGTK